jgi:hypothetical protein
MTSPFTMSDWLRPREGGQAVVSGRQGNEQGQGGGVERRRGWSKMSDKPLAREENICNALRRILS